MKLPVEQVAGIVNLCGPTDLTAPEVEGLMKFSGMFEGQENKAELLKQASPVYLPNAQLPPLLTLHCRQDGVVNFQQALRIKEVWLQRGGALQVLYYLGQSQQGHNIWRDESPSPLLYQMLEWQILAFLNSYMSR